MKVKVSGFEWIIPPFTDLLSFCRYLASQSGTPYDKHLFALAEKDPYWVGVILTDKPGKAYCQKRKEGPNFTVTARELEAGTNIVDFNFFILRSDTGRGLYQYYHNSCRPNTFHHFFKQRFDGFAGNLLRQAQAQLDPSVADSGNALAERFDDSLKYTTLVKQESLDHLIADMARVKSFDFECTTLHAVEDEFRPLTEVAKRVSHHMTFHKNKFVDDAKGMIRAIASKANYFKKGKIVGVDPAGNEVAYNLLENPDSFSEANYDDWILTVNLDSTRLVDSLKESQIIGNLLSLASKPRIAALLATPASP